MIIIYNVFIYIYIYNIYMHTYIYVFSSIEKLCLFIFVRRTFFYLGHIRAQDKSSKKIGRDTATFPN